MNAATTRNIPDAAIATRRPHRRPALDIDTAPVVWARPLSDARNAQLLRHFADRTVWRLEAVKEPESWEFIAALGELHEFDEEYEVARYYYAQAMKKQGGVYADHSRKLVENLLLAIQNPQEGNWEGTGGDENHGRVYATTLAILSLSVKHGFLPIYQD